MTNEQVTKALKRMFSLMEDAWYADHASDEEAFDELKANVEELGLTMVEKPGDADNEKRYFVYADKDMQDFVFAHTFEVPSYTVLVAEVIFREVPVADASTDSEAIDKVRQQWTDAENILCLARAYGEYADVPESSQEQLQALHSVALWEEL